MLHTMAIQVFQYFLPTFSFLGKESTHEFSMLCVCVLSLSTFKTAARFS